MTWLPERKLGRLSTSSAGKHTPDKSNAVKQCTQAMVTTGVASELAFDSLNFLYVCGPRESIRQSTKESVGMGNKGDRNTIRFG